MIFYYSLHAYAQLRYIKITICRAASEDLDEAHTDTVQEAVERIQSWARIDLHTGQACRIRGRDVVEINNVAHLSKKQS